MKELKSIIKTIEKEMSNNKNWKTNKNSKNRIKLREEDDNDNEKNTDDQLSSE